MGVDRNWLSAIFGNKFSSWCAEIILYPVSGQMGYSFLYNNGNLLGIGDKFIYEIICLDKIDSKTEIEIVKKVSDLG